MANRNKVGFTFTKPQLVRLFDTINTPKVMIAVFLARMIGLRIEEVCRLKWENIDLKNRVVTILDSKWKHRARDGYGKDRFVRLPQLAVAPVERWRSIIGGGTWFIPSEKTPDLHMRKKTLYEQFTHFLRLAGLDEVHYEFTTFRWKGGQKEPNKAKRRKLNFHSLRAYWVVDCRRRGVPIEIIAEQAGHEDINTTVGYARYTDEEKNQILDRAYDKPSVGLAENGLAISMRTNQTVDTTLHFTPLQFLQMQLVRGEISRQDYLEKLKLLQSPEVLR